MQRQLQQVYLIITFILTVIGTISAQKPQERWITGGISGRISSKWSVSFSRQYSINDSLTYAKYYLDDIRLTYTFKKRFEVIGAWSYLISDPSDKTPSVKQRATVGLGYKTNFGGFRFSLRTVGERHFGEKKFDYRIVPAARLEYTRFDIGNVDIRPFVITQMYYHIGGDSIKQFNVEGKYVGQNVPYGWHRARVRAGLSVSPCSWLQIGAFYLWQTEFNTIDAINNNHRVNVYNPETKKIARPFDDYEAIGATLTFILGAKKSRKEHSATDDTN